MSLLKQVRFQTCTACDKQPRPDWSAHFGLPKIALALAEENKISKPLFWSTRYLGRCSVASDATPPACRQKRCVIVWMLDETPLRKLSEGPPSAQKRLTASLRPRDDGHNDGRSADARWTQRWTLDGHCKNTTKRTSP